ncbi:acyl carrier protein [Paenibacillus frigoriresistens]|uniref:acyl carrier protein n=1 Tax=Paenibacillus alginolyticus TaxID=59839 RepID=UPI0015657553|nr:acyl carrier protein [Paenibacillus frigoriresistens]NRF95580.1 acyl carrier protein [Paenibacillus frigoriresistens]
MTFNEFKQLVSEFSQVPIKSIEKDTSFRNDLGIDSLQMVNLIVRLTECTGIDISKISNMGDIDTASKMYGYFYTR